MEHLQQRFKEMLAQIGLDEQGHLTLMGTRSVITPAGSLLGIMEASNDILGERGTWIIMYRAGYDTALAFSRAMIDVHGMDPSEVALAYSDFARLRGWGFCKLMGFDLTEGHGRIHVHGSVFADHFRARGDSQRPVCAFIAGALAGITHAVSGMQVRAKELQCAAIGADYCEIVVEPF